MKPGTQEGKDLTERDLDRFLGRLGPDRVAAAAEYVKIRHKLADFFAWRGSPCPEDHADLTLDRIARRLDQGAPVEHLRGYAYGVARKVLLESARDEKRKHAALESLRLQVTPEGESALKERRARCLKQCLSELPEASRALVVEYHQWREGSLFERRRLLAQRLGIAPGALRTRVHRIRVQLEECLERCLASL